MQTKESVMKRWNLFARELEDILNTRGIRLSQLDDHVGIHREKVRRLRRSLQIPKSFPTLSPDEMDKVIDFYCLTEDEMLRLRAAIIATSIEAMLMNRINQNDALKAAEQILPIIELALQQHITETSGIGALRGGSIMGDEIYTDVDMALDTALDAIDRGIMALHLSRNVLSAMDRLEQMYRARDNFAVALAELEEADNAIQVTEVWRMWYNEAKRNHQIIINRIADLVG
jgi:hypothetical protein